jgi:ribonuclease HI
MVQDMTTENFDVIAYVDGACKGNPGVGGWGVLLIINNEPHEYYGGERYTTNNKMELTAAIEALKRCPDKPIKILAITDSQYTIKGITEWIKNWRNNGWKSTNGQPVKNCELWQELDQLMSTKDVKWSWVRGHNGDAGNEVADALANKGIFYTGK